MDGKSIKILILDDEIEFLEELQELLLRRKFAVLTASNERDAFDVLKNNEIDLMLLDLRLGTSSGLDVLKKIKSDFSNVKVIMMTGHGDMEVVIQAMRLGAVDFLQKPFSYESLRSAIDRSRVKSSNSSKTLSYGDKNSLISSELQKEIESDFIGKSIAIRKINEVALIAARHPAANVVIIGESGTGKEIVARIIHYASERKNNKFLAVNCAAIPSQLMESEFFGHRKGSFTGAVENRAGHFEVADKGTLFLDEISEMPMEMQGKLLRSIEEKKITRIGESKEIAFDCRILAATNKNIQKLVSDGKFRLDLLHRLQTLVIKLPPLRERKEDIELLINYFAKLFLIKYGKSSFRISSKIISKLESYNFPGNVRELRNLIERAMILSDDGNLDILCDLLAFEDEEKGEEHKHSSDDEFNLEEHEKELIKLAMLKCDGNQSKAAELLGIDRLALSRRIKKYNI